MILYPLRYVWWLLSSVRRAIGRPPDYVVFVLEDGLPALPDPPRPFWQRFAGRPRLSVRELAERFEAIARDPRIQGVVLHIRPTPMPMATLQDLRELVGRLRAAHKRVIAWAPSYTTAGYYLACACDEILLMPTGSVQALGFATTGIFLAEGLARVGVAADFIQVSPYKTAADVLTKSKMSDEYRDQVNWLLESNYAELVGAIAQARLLDETGARHLIDCSPYGDDVAVAQHAIDRVLAEEELPAHLARGGGNVTLGTWERARRKMRTPAPVFRVGRYVALMRIEGMIVDGRSERLPVKPPIELPLVGEERAGDLSVVQVARAVAADKRAAALVLYVNSRGGSSTASEAMRQALAVVAGRKPVVAVMGPVAGSGGYWVSTPASWIVARPGTLTGSIGVLGGKVVTGSMWAKLLFNRETVSLGEHVLLQSDERAFSDEERRLVGAEIDRIYRTFIDLVAKARKLSAEQVTPVAAGKVWTGRQALERKLVDELGGVDAGLAAARRLAGLPDSAPLREVRGPKRTLPPSVAAMPAAGWLGFALEGLSLLGRAPALAVMEFLPADIS